MLNRLIYDRLRSLIVVVKRSVTFQSDIDLGKQMKMLNDDKQFEKALNLFDIYKEKDIKTYSSMIITQALKACTQIGDLQRGLTIYHLVSFDMKDDPYILASIIHLYMQCGYVTNAQSLFDSATNKTLSMYGAMMTGYLKNNQANKAIELFNEVKNPNEILVTLLFNACAKLATAEALHLVKKVSSTIQKSFHSDLILLTSLLDALVKCGDVKHAQLLFNSSTKKNISMYGAMMNGFNKTNDPFKTLNLFNQMKIDGIKADRIIYLCLIKSLAEIGDYLLSKSFVEQIPNYFLIDNQSRAALIDMWGKTGHIDQAKQIFEKISQPDQVVYAAMINSYGLNGMGIQAIQLFRQIPPRLIDDVTYICVLNACSHSGLVDEARSVFKNIQRKTGKIYTTMIDCLSRGSFFEEAQKLIDEFELDHSPIWPMYMALLSGARNKNSIHLSQKIYDRTKKLFPELTNSLISATILLANVYASSGEIEKASNIRILLNELGAKKKIGLSWTVVNGKFFEFRAHDQFHPRSEEIYAELEKISKELISHGHEYDSSWITRPLNQDETVASALCGHSEKLAIAWNFVENPNTTRIQVTKNLRVCGDCHRATKLIASIRQCEIIVRDANRIHHFYTNGQCSCNDYF